MHQPTSGSLFSGYGGLDLAVEHVFGARTVWHAEWEDAPSTVLARHWPDVPNYRDVTAVDWTAVEPVDIITGGFPCQDVSLAGRRAGMTEGTRSNLWGAMRTAIETIRPTYVVAENVRGLLSAHAESASDMEPRSGLLGDPRGGSLRALGRVLGDLADMRYDAQWYGLRASDVGAPHHRFRVFILATRRDAPHGHGLGGHRPGAPGLEVRRGEPADGRVGAPDAAGNGRYEGRTEPAGKRGRPHAPLSGPHAPDADGAGLGGVRRIERAQRDPDERDRADAHGDHPESATRTDWGPYAAAVHRWEHALGRLAPAPTEPNSKGKPRLSPAFTEWMMGLPEGWVTDTPGLKRADYLTALGNGVVPQQAAHALTRILNSLHTLPPAHTKEAHDA